MANVQIKVPDWLDRICAWPLMLYRRWKYGYSFRRIYLGDREYTIVDPDVYYQLGHFKWFLIGKKNKFYAERSIKTGPHQTTIQRLHRVIMNAPKGMIVDHKNGNGLDNRRENLRLATFTQNNYNASKRKNTSSQYKGVYFSKSRQRWRASIRFDGKRISLGTFKAEIDAAKAYDAAAKKYHTVFAKLNFPEENSA